MRILRLASALTATVVLSTLSACGGSEVAATPPAAATDKNDPVSPADTPSVSEPTGKHGYKAPDTVGNLVNDVEVLTTSRERAAAFFTDLDPAIASEETQLLFAGDVGPHRIVVAVARDDSVIHEAPPVGRNIHIRRIVLSGPAGADVNELDIVDNGNDSPGTDEWSVSVPTGDGVTVVAYPRTKVHKIQVATVPLRTTRLRWVDVPVRQGWASTYQPGVYSSAVLVRRLRGNCAASTLVSTTKDRPRAGEKAARAALSRTTCVAGGG